MANLDQLGYIKRPMVSPMSHPIAQSAIMIRDLETIAELEPMLRLEKEVWALADADVTPITLAVALKAAGSILIGAFDAAPSW